MMKEKACIIKNEKVLFTKNFELIGRDLTDEEIDMLNQPLLIEKIIKEILNVNIIRLANIRFSQMF